MTEKDCIICDEYYSLSDIEKLGLDQFSYLINCQKPKNLFKYFRNQVSEDGINHDIEALENDTVYVNDAEQFDDCFDCAVDLNWRSFYERRIKKYAQYFNIDILDIAAELENLDAKICAKILDYETAEIAIKNIDINLDAAQKLSLEHLILVIYLAKSNDLDFKEIMHNYIWNEFNEFRKCLQHFKIACFTVSPYLNRMWATNNSKGFCIEYDIDPAYSPELYTSIFPVIYSQKRNDFTLLIQNIEQLPKKSDLWQMYFNGLLRKSIHWTDQHEWRLISYQNDNKAKSVPFFRIKKVYIGNKISPIERKKIIHICQAKGYDYVGLLRQSDSFDLKECNGDCATCLNQCE